MVVLVRSLLALGWTVMLYLHSAGYDFTTNDHQLIPRRGRSEANAFIIWKYYVVFQPGACVAAHEK